MKTGCGRAVMGVISGHTARFESQQSDFEKKPAVPSVRRGEEPRNLYKREQEK
jgi:hypothetical protein